MSLAMIESFLEKTIGLSAEAIGPEVIAKAVLLRMTDLGLPDMTAYQGYLNTTDEEQAALVEAVVVPETWFFRNGKAFGFLVSYVTRTWFRENRGCCLRALSIPCSTGEEAYSIAMALMDAKIQNDRFHIDGIDISEAALAVARMAVYGQGSFRGEDLSFRKRYFTPKGDAFQLHAEVRQAVRFLKGNVLNERFLMDQGPYDIIFCRNLLIYLSLRAKERTLEIMDRLLTDSGILFLGHAERQAAVEWGLARIPEFGVFACRKERRKETRALKPSGEPRPCQRRFERAGNSLQLPQPLASARSVGKESGSNIPVQEPDNREPTVSQRNLFEEAQRLADRGFLSSALALCQDFLNEHPVHVQAHFLMGLIYEALDSVEKAKDFFNKAIYLDPDHSGALNHLSFIVEHQGDKGRAAHMRQRAQRVSRKQAGI